MKEQILELLASPQAIKLQAFLQDLAEAPQESPLLAALCGAVAGILVCALFMGLLTKRRRKINHRRWQAEVTELTEGHQREVSELQTTRDSLRKQVETLSHKTDGLNKTLEQDRAELLKERAAVKSLEHVVEEKNLKIQKTIDDAAHRIAQHQGMQKKLNAVLERRNTELERLKSAASNPVTGLPISKALLDSIEQRDDEYQEQVARRIDLLDQQRQELLQERDELALREKHYADQLTEGDDTRAYLDETLVLAGLGTTASTPSTEKAAEDPKGESTQSEDYEATQSLAPDSGTAKTSLWNKVISSVSRGTEKSRTDKTEA
ncbi:MAG: hypothetical protein KTR33_08075 [Gammaproteobacteria bacterium]|nr:hypothetical protein [Gammaproteobacteria bacterium]